jgi:hypothetical protein
VREGRGGVVNIDPLLLLGLLMLGMALGALLMRIRFKSEVARIVSEQLDEEGNGRELRA